MRYWKLSNWPIRKISVKKSLYRAVLSIMMRYSEALNASQDVMPSVLILPVLWVLSVLLCWQENITPDRKLPCFRSTRSMICASKLPWHAVKAAQTIVCLRSTALQAADSSFQETAANAVSESKRMKNMFLTFLNIRTNVFLRIIFHWKKRKQSVEQSVFQEFWICMRTIRSGLHSLRN